jgi:hypothetical protein
MATGFKDRLQEFKCHLFASVKDDCYSEPRERQQLVLKITTTTGKGSWLLTSWDW